MQAKSPRKICVITGSRAEYGLLSGLMGKIQADLSLQLQVIVTGSHLEDRYGATLSYIRQDGFSVDAQVAIAMNDDSSLGICNSVGLAVRGVAMEIEKLDPDIVVVLGDRFEILGAAQAAMLCKRTIAHIHGGERTEGAMDDSIRHAITKLAHIHFVATEIYRRRVIQLGERPEHVHRVGAPGLDAIETLDTLPISDLENLTGIKLDQPFLLVTFHPVTTERNNGLESVETLLGALQAAPDLKIVFTGVNADPGNQAIRKSIEDFAADNPGRCAIKQSLGQRGYLSAMKNCAAVVGNSSSGIIEAPSMGKPTVDIGTRQKGRVAAASVIHCDDSRDQIADAISRAISPEFSQKAKNVENPYGPPGAAGYMVNILRDSDLTSIQQKHFYDLPMAELCP